MGKQESDRDRAVRDVLSRRDFLRAGALTVGGLTFSTWLARSAGAEDVPAAAPGAAPAASPPAARAHSVIQLWMGGGPTHIDTFDPKPEAGEDYSGPLRKPLNTNVTGMRISELLPLLAKQADKYSILRSMTHSNNGHETATYIVQTGTLPSADMVYPSTGAVVAYKRLTEGGYKGALPPFITLTSPLGRFSEAGFLGPEYQTFATGGDPSAKEFAVQGLVPPRGMGADRMKDRRALLDAVDGLAQSQENDPTLAAMSDYQRRAYEMMLGPAGKAFDLTQEKDALRDRYGRNHFGQCCLAARRLVEQGVPFIRVNHGGWDTHKDNFPAMKRMLPILDAGFSTLLDDLAQRGLLASTIVVWIGEFGRTPKVQAEPPWNGGRHHYGQVFSAVVAGGGFKGGHVVGASDNRGENVRERPIYPWDLSGTIYKLLGIEPTGRLPHPQGCLAYVTPQAGGDVQSGGLLNEII